MWGLVVVLFKPALDYHASHCSAYHLLIWLPRIQNCCRFQINPQSIRLGFNRIHKTNVHSLLLFRCYIAEMLFKLLLFIITHTHYILINCIYLEYLVVSTLQPQKHIACTCDEGYLSKTSCFSGNYVYYTEHSLHTLTGNFKERLYTCSLMQLSR